MGLTEQQVASSVLLSLKWQRTGAAGDAGSDRTAAVEYSGEYSHRRIPTGIAVTIAVAADNCPDDTLGSGQWPGAYQRLPQFHAPAASRFTRTTMSCRSSISMAASPIAISAASCGISSRSSPAAQKICLAESLSPPAAKLLTMSSSFTGLALGLAASIAPHLPAPRRQFPELARSVHHLNSSEWRARRSDLGSAHNKHHLKRARINGRDHVYGCSDG